MRTHTCVCMCRVRRKEGVCVCARTRVYVCVHATRKDRLHSRVEVLLKTISLPNLIDTNRSLLVLARTRVPMPLPFSFTIIGAGGVRRSEKIDGKRGNVGVAGHAKARK